MDQLLIVVPVYGHWDYALRAVQSAFSNTRKAETWVLVVDDASPDSCSAGAQEARQAMVQSLPANGHLEFISFSENGGLLRSLNAGLRYARENKLECACCANSDVFFCPGWDRALLAALNTYHLVGPVTNAPGTEEGQCITRFQEGYELTDQTEYLDWLASSLWRRYQEQVVPGTINGFCMMAKTETWWEHAWDSDNVFSPYNKVNSKGLPNPTPLTTLGEYELQRRWHAANLKSGFCPGSFVLHYRSVSRGDRHKKGLWLRATP